MNEEPLRLQLGSGQSPQQGYINIDINPYEGVDLVYDLDKIPWPFEDSSVDEILALDVLEHLAPLGRAMGQYNIVGVLTEVYRVLKPGGVLKARIPTTDGPGAWQDPTHITYWNMNTFLYFTLGCHLHRSDWPGFHMYGQEEDHHMMSDRPVRWVKMVLVKPGGENEPGDNSIHPDPRKKNGSNDGTVIP